MREEKNTPLGCSFRRQSLGDLKREKESVLIGGNNGRRI